MVLWGLFPEHGASRSPARPLLPLLHIGCCFQDGGEGIRVGHMTRMPGAGRGRLGGHSVQKTTQQWECKGSDPRHDEAASLKTPERQRSWPKAEVEQLGDFAEEGWPSSSFPRPNRLPEAPEARSATGGDCKGPGRGRGAPECLPGGRLAFLAWIPSPFNGGCWGSIACVPSRGSCPVEAHPASSAVSGCGLAGWRAGWRGFLRATAQFTFMQWETGGELEIGAGRGSGAAELSLDGESL